jgi:hypothetical protein
VALGRKLHTEMIATTIFVFFTLLLRSVFSTMCAPTCKNLGQQLLISARTLLFAIHLTAPNRYAAAFTLQDYGKNCPGKNQCDSTCYNVYSHYVLWTSYTPEFQLTVVLISSPIALLVGLWGVTNKLTLHLLRSSNQEMPIMHETLQIM